jgi:hypothetical protein
MNDLFLFSSTVVPKERLEGLLRQGMERAEPSGSLHAYTRGFQVKHPRGILFDLNAMDPSEVYLADEEKAAFKAFYCLSYHPAEIDRVLAVLADAIRQCDFVVAADAEGYTPRFLPAQLQQLAQYVRDTELRD